VPATGLFHAFWLAATGRNKCCSAVTKEKEECALCLKTLPDAQHDVPR
jgi:hypothetical protein